MVRQRGGACKPCRQQRHDPLPLGVGIAHPVADFLKSPAAAGAKSGGGLQGAEVNAGRLHEGYIGVSKSRGKGAKSGDLANLLRCAQRIAGVAGKLAADEIGEGKPCDAGGEQACDQRP